MLLYVFGWVSQETDSELEASVKEFTGNVLCTGSTPKREQGRVGEEQDWAEGGTDLMGRPGAGMAPLSCPDLMQGTRPQGFNLLLAVGCPGSVTEVRSWLWLAAVLRGRQVRTAVVKSSQGWRNELFCSDRG